MRKTVTSDELEATKRTDGTRNYRDLLVWQKAMSLAKRTYELTTGIPAEEKFGLISQMRRAAVSIPSNIGEGQARHTTGEFVQFISNAEGSLAELDTQLALSLELSFVKPSEVAEMRHAIEKVRKMLNALRRKLVTRHLGSGQAGQTSRRTPRTPAGSRR